MGRYRHIKPGQRSKPTPRWAELALAGLGAQPYLRSQAERRRSERAIAMRQIAKALDRCKTAFADGSKVQALVDERWTVRPYWYDGEWRRH